jgi:hypothetical protein
MGVMTLAARPGFGPIHQTALRSRSIRPLFSSSWRRAEVPADEDSLIRYYSCRRPIGLKSDCEDESTTSLALPFNSV